MTCAPDDLLVRWDNLINRLVFLEKRFVFRHGQLRLHPSEIHVLLAVREEPQANATRLASRLGVTKGAVSQVLKRLEAKAVVAKHIDPAQKNEMTVTFTPLGSGAVDAFLSEKAEARREYLAYLAGLSDAERETIRRFLDQFAAFLTALE